MTDDILSDGGMTRQREVCILFNQVDASSSPSDLDVLVQVQVVRDALRHAGYSINELACTLDLRQLRERLESLRPDVVFNLVESLDGIDRLMPAATLVLDTLGIAYTGAKTEVILLTNDKIATKRRLRGLGLPTPDWIEGTSAASRDASCGAGALLTEGKPGRYIVKAIAEHASWGMDDGSVVDGAVAARELLARRERETGKPHFAEAFIAGREFNLSLIAGRSFTEAVNPGPQEIEVLPPAEIDFSSFAPGKPRIVGYAAKWSESSQEYQGTPRRFPDESEERELLSRLRDLAQRCWHGLGLTGYARVDFRVDEQGEPWILEINANPCLSPDAGFAAAVERGGGTLDQTIVRIVREAISRNQTAHSAVAKASVNLARGSEAEWMFRSDVRPGDVERVRGLVAATGMFTAAEVDVAVELVEETLAKGDRAGYFYAFADDESGNLAGYACYGPIPCTVTSYDLYWIVVSPEQQGKGLGRRLLRECEERVRRLGGERLYIETSCREQYVPTRRFYERCEYVCEAVLKDFYAPADDRATYVKWL